MAFTHKDWKDEPDHTTAISAAALKDLEDRLAAYTDAETAATLAAAVAASLQVSENLADVPNPATARANIGAAAASGGGGGGPGTPGGPVAIEALIPNATTTTIQNSVIVAAGATATLATLSGAGVLRNLQMTHSTAAGAEVGRLQIFVDGESLPSIDVEWGTLFGIQPDSFPANSNGALLSNRRASTSISAALTGTSSGALNFPIPYSDGLVIKWVNAANAAAVASSVGLYISVQYQPGAITDYTDRWRLRSACGPYLSAVGIKHTVIPFFDIPKMAGLLVYFAAAAGGAADYGYLERPWDVLVDGEGSASYHGNSEDWFNSGYFLGGMQSFSSALTTVYAANVGSSVFLGGVDLLEMVGGVKFSSELAMQYGRTSETKTGDIDDTNVELGFVALFYVDTNVSFTPSAPAVGRGTGAGALTFPIHPPASPGSSPILGYDATLNPGAVHQSLGPSATSVTFGGLSNGTAYTVSVTARNTTGSGNAGSSGGTPSATGASWSGAVLARSPLIWLRASESGGAIAYDSSGNARHGRYNGAYVLGQSGATTDNDGAVAMNTATTPAFIAVPHTAGMGVTSAFSLLCWVYLTSYGTSNFPAFFMKSYTGVYTSSDWLLQLEATSHKLGFYTANTVHSALSTGTIALNAWTMVVVTYDNTNVRFYLNGSLDSTVAIAAPAATQAPLFIGSQPGGSSSTTTFGNMDEIAIFNSTLSGAQITALYGAR